MNRIVKSCVLILIATALVLSCACVTQEQGAPATPAATTAPAGKITVKVFHAGSLTGPFEKLKAEFETKYPQYRGPP